MTVYTADAVSLLIYLVDALPHAADRVFAEAEAGETVLKAPSAALAEVLYSVGHEKSIRGVPPEVTPEAARQALVENGPVSLAPVDDGELNEYAQVESEFNIHDRLIVASHRTRGTDAIITTDSTMVEAGYPTLWE